MNVFRVVFSYILSIYFTFSVSSFDISANAGQDYTAITNQKITFNPNGPTTQEIAVNLTNDALLEGTESLLLAASSLHTNIKIGQIANTTVRIFDDDGKFLAEKCYNYVLIYRNKRLATML